MRKKILSQLATSELIAIAKRSAKNDQIQNEAFRSANCVKFTFVELCSSLNRRRANGKRILKNEEYNIIKEGCKAKKAKEISKIFDDVQERYEEYIMESR